MSRNDLLQQVSDRLTAFQLALLREQVPDAEARVKSVADQFDAAIKAWDSSERDTRAPLLLDTLMHAVWDSLDFHDVREFRTSRGEVMTRCNQCRYGEGHLSDGFSAANPDRWPHVFNRRIGYTKRHQVADGKELVVVKRAVVSSGLPAVPSTKLSASVAKLCSVSERQRASEADAAQTSEERDAATSALADVSREKDGEFTVNGQRVQLCGEKLFILENAEAKAQGLNGGRASSADRKYNAWQRDNAQAEGTPETYDAYEYICKTYPSEVCEEWRWNYLQFFKDMGSKPKGKILTRWRDSGEFNKSNCFWATKKQWAAERKRRGQS